MGNLNRFYKADDFCDVRIAESISFLRVGMNFGYMSVSGRIFIMLTSLALIFLLGLGMAAVCQKCGLPRIIGMLLTGIVLGPYVLN